MENDPVKDYLVQKVFSAENMVFRIGELSTMTGVSSRQLRYWEQKNYIHSIQRGDDQAARMYHFREYARVTGIKHFLDQGFTLVTAVAKMNEYIDTANAIHNFVKESIKGVATKDGHLEIDLGWFDQDQHERIIAVQNGEGFSYKIIQH